jgi:D-arabinose 1-dehydrogenase-like Zn-dependent alcohol dehydrogenase
MNNVTPAAQEENIMKALRIHEYGGPLQLDEVEKPVVGAGQVGTRLRPEV